MPAQSRQIRISFPALMAKMSVTNGRLATLRKAALPATNYTNLSIRFLQAQPCKYLQCIAFFHVAIIFLNYGSNYLVANIRNS